MKANTQTVILPIEFEEETMKRIAKLQKQAAKLGLAEVKFTKTVKETPYFVGDERRVAKDLVIEIENDPVRLGDYRLLAKIDFADGFPCIDAVPGEEAPEWARETEATRCDHCGHKRHRNVAYIVRHAETGEVVQVGSACVKDFLGVTPARLLTWCNTFHNMDESDFPYVEPHTDVEKFLATTAAVIRTYGWTSKAMESETSGRIATAYTVQEYLHGTGGSARELRDEVGEPTEHDIKLAGDVLKWLDMLAEKTNLSDYEYNLVNLKDLAVVRMKRYGLMASAVAGYWRHVRFTEEKKAKAAKAVSKHVGEIKERLNIKAEVLYTRFIEGYWSTTTLVVLKDDAGNIFKWFATGSHEYDKGDVVEGKGTVKKHGEWNGIPETVLTRCNLKVLETA